VVGKAGLQIKEYNELVKNFFSWSGPGLYVRGENEKLKGFS
jgi:hypothetical protein